jgi:uncharacterized membrane protein YbaN (DUF454 family)
VNKHAKKVMTYVAGWFFIFLGIVGLFLPILQGILFIAIGLLILSRESPWAQKMLMKLEKKYPKQYAEFEKFKRKMSSYFKR